MNTVSNSWSLTSIRLLLDKALSTPKWDEKQEVAHELGLYKGIIVGAIIGVGIVIKMTKE